LTKSDGQTKHVVPGSWEVIIIESGKGTIGEKGGSEVTKRNDKGRDWATIGARNYYGAWSSAKGKETIPEVEAIDGPFNNLWRELSRQRMS